MGGARAHRIVVSKGSTRSAALLKSIPSVNFNSYKRKIPPGNQDHTLSPCPWLPLTSLNASSRPMRAVVVKVSTIVAAHPFLQKPTSTRASKEKEKKRGGREENPPSPDEDEHGEASTSSLKKESVGEKKKASPPGSLPIPTNWHDFIATPSSKLILPKGPAHGLLDLFGPLAIPSSSTAAFEVELYGIPVSGTLPLSTTAGCTESRW